MFRFTIRDVLWLTVVVAFGVGCWIDRNLLFDVQYQVATMKAESAARENQLDSLSLENLRLKEELRKRGLLDQAEPGVYFLNPLTRTSPGGRSGNR